jgi:hypothetical protein
MNRWKWALALASCGAWAYAAGGCSAATNGGAFDSATAPGNGGGFSDAGGAAFGGANASSSSGSPALPPEVKVESAFRSPVATGQVVWIANPSSGRVAYIDATTFVVKTVQAGNQPTYLAAVPDLTIDKALVLNVLSQDATLLALQQGTLTTRTFPSTANANAWAVSKSGRWAIAWTDTTAVTNADPTQGFQDVVVLDLSDTNPRPPTTLSVGFRPVQVAFDADLHAFVVSQDGISVIDLQGGAQPALTANYPLPTGVAPAAPDAQALDAASEAQAPDASLPEGGDDAGPAGGGANDASDGGADHASDAGVAPTPTSVVPDVSFTPDGTYALVRQDGLPSITVVSLATGATATVDLPALPTDLTLSPAGDFALVVMRDTATVAILPVPGIASAPTSFSTVTITGETVGRAIVTDQGQTALLFTTAAPVERMTVLSLGTSPSYRTIPLHAPVLAVFPSADARSAIVLHSLTAPSNGVKGAFSVVPIATAVPAHIVSLPAPPTAVAISPNGDRALVAMRDDSTATYGVYLADTSSLAAMPYPLASPPIAVGIVAGASTGYAAQDYSDGRITFIDLEGDGGPATARTITGFELGARVVEGSAQP